MFDFRRAVTAAPKCLIAAPAALALALATTVSPALAATDLYVAPTGNDANDCLSAATPCATVSAAIGKATSGDTIHLAPGAYSEQVVIDKSVSLVGPNAGVDPNAGGRGAEATFSGAGPVFTLQDGTSGVTDVTIDGLAFSNVTGTGYNGVITVPGFGAGNVTIANNSFSTITEEAIGYHGNMGLSAPLGSGWLVERNRVEQVTGANRSGMFFGNLSDSVIRDNVIVDPARSGIVVSGGTNVTLSGNTVSGAVFGLNIGTDASSDPITNVVVEGNTVTDSGVGIVINSPSSVPDVTISFNRLDGNTTGLFSNATSAIDAENQWWGCNAGPADAACDPVAGNVDFSPWLVLTLAADPAALQTGTTATLSAALTTNSDGSVVAGGSITDGTSIAFSVDAGTLSSSTAATAGGVATVTFTAGSTPQTVTAQAALDGQVVSATLSVTAAPPSATPVPSPTPTATASPAAGGAGLPDTSIGGGFDALPLAALVLIGSGILLVERRRRGARERSR